MFWLSFEAIDDAIPTYPGSAGHGWATLYHPHGAAADHGGTGTPIYFDGTATEGVGIIFLGSARRRRCDQPRVRPENRRGVDVRADLHVIDPDFNSARLGVVRAKLELRAYG